MVKLINLKLKLIDSLMPYSINLEIYSKKDKLIVTDKTDINGNYRFTVPNKGIYKIFIYNYKIHLNKKCIVLNINDFSPCNFEFYIKRFEYVKKHLITINFTDFFYENLPIKKGKIILWQENI